LCGGSSGQIARLPQKLPLRDEPQVTRAAGCNALELTDKLPQAGVPTGWRILPADYAVNVIGHHHERGREYPGPLPKRLVPGATDDLTESREFHTRLVESAKETAPALDDHSDEIPVRR